MTQVAQMQQVAQEAQMAQHGTASHYCHKGLTRASQRPAKHEWHTMAQVLIISTHGALAPVKDDEKHKWHSMAQLPIISTRGISKLKRTPVTLSQNVPLK